MYYVLNCRYPSYMVTKYDVVSHVLYSLWTILQYLMYCVPKVNPKVYSIVVKLPGNQ